MGLMPIQGDGFPKLDSHSCTAFKGIPHAIENYEIENKK